jgi:hypothetical protein
MSTSSPQVKQTRSNPNCDYMTTVTSPLNVIITVSRQQKLPNVTDHNKYLSFHPKTQTCAPLSFAVNSGFSWILHTIAKVPRSLNKINNSDFIVLKCVLCYTSAKNCVELETFQSKYIKSAFWLESDCYHHSSTTAPHFPKTGIRSQISATVFVHSTSAEKLASHQHYFLTINFVKNFNAWKNTFEWTVTTTEFQHLK